MREIKFRVWDEKYGMMPIQKISLKTMKSMPYGWNIAYDFGTVMQYTGLKDENGKEIYEGDIVKIEDDKCTIEFNNYGFGAKSLEYKDFILFGEVDMLDTHVIEVIGNIYENPELLEGN